MRVLNGVMLYLDFDRKQFPLNMLGNLLEFTHVVRQYDERGIPFRVHLHVPEIHPYIGNIFLEREDEGHVLKRIAQCTRNGGPQKLQLEMYAEALHDSDAGLTYLALVGSRKQSIEDAERLFSSLLKCMEKKNYLYEARYIRAIMGWRQARSRLNYHLLNFILEEWMPWYNETYDFSLLEVNRYAPSLRQLRQYALVLMFPSTLASRLASRLQQIIRQEEMVSSISTLMALCEKADNDIRACLNTLQFVNRKHTELTVNLVQSASIGQKDAQMSLFSLWKAIFQLSSAKRRPVDHNRDTAGAYNGGHAMGTAAARFYHMHSASSATGEYEKVCHGLFENYLNIRFKDPNLEAVCVGLDWMQFHDTLQQHIMQTQNYAFWSYLPYLSVAFHFLFASPSKPFIRFPHAHFEMVQKMKKSEHLLSSVMLEVPAHIHRMLTSTQLAIEMLAPILEIITPTFRPVSTQLYTAREKQQLSDLVDTMISYGLTYKQEKGPDGQYTYVLDPCLEDVCRFPGLAQKKQLSYGAKQLIAREVEVEKMRRMEKMMCGNETAPLEKSDGQKSAKRTDTVSEAVSRKSLKKSKVIKLVKEKPTVDFFGRTVKSGRTAVGGTTAAASPVQHPLWFRFNEGFSNAVRRPVRIQDLL